MTAPDALSALPTPRTPDPKDAPSLRWGILGPGGIATAFAEALAAKTQQQIVAVGSRSMERAQTFADRFGAAKAYGSYAELVADGDVDVIYVASPHSEHHEHALLALAAGKPVLVEKAFTRNAGEAREVVAAARERGLFAMEAMWTRFLPGVDVVRQCLEQGLLGEIETVFADHGQPLYPGGPARLSQPELAGGALLDLGIYPISFASFVLGGLTSVQASGDLTDLGVDSQVGMVARGQRRGLGMLHATMAARSWTTASVVGTAGRLDLGDTQVFGSRWYGPGQVRFTGRDDANSLVFEGGPDRYGLAFEAAEVARCIAGGLTESPLLTLDETVRIMEFMDDVRAQVGVRLPGE